MARYAHIRRVSLPGPVQVRVELDFWLDGSVRRGDVRSGCSEVRVFLDLETDAPASDVAEVIRLARAGCFLERMVAEPTPVRAEVHLNGAPIGHAVDP